MTVVCLCRFVVEYIQWSSQAVRHLYLKSNQRVKLSWYHVVERRQYAPVMAPDGWQKEKKWWEGLFQADSTSVCWIQGISERSDGNDVSWMLWSSHWWTRLKFRTNMSDSTPLSSSKHRLRNSLLLEWCSFHHRAIVWSYQRHFQWLFLSFVTCFYVQTPPVSPESCGVNPSNPLWGTKPLFEL